MGVKGRMIVIADDITGAAEIAGIASSQGKPVRLLCGCPVSGDRVAANTTVVIATDTRSMTEPEAVAETQRIILSLSFLRPDGSKRPLVEREGAGERLFKKTDSALRGHVVAELAALMQATGYRRAVYLPANPSKGRYIRAGLYYIGEKPIAETDFRFDPEYPAATSVLQERFPDAAAHHILMLDAESMEDIRRVVAEYDDGHTLFAGAADLYESLTSGPSPRGEGSGHTQGQTPYTPLSPWRGAGSEALILCGSTQSRPLDLDIPVRPMPAAIYDGSNDLTLWNTDAYAETHSLILTIPHTHRTGKDVAVHLRTMMAAKAKALVAQHLPDHLIIEGGATAWATVQALGWHDFTIVRQLAPGVVQMRAQCGTLVTLKPGSYPWGGIFLK